MKNNILIVALVIIIGVLSGVSLLFGIGNAVGVAVSPLAGQLGAIGATQRSIEQKLGMINGADNKAVLAKLDAIEKRLANLENRAPSPAAQAPQPPQEDLNKVYDLPVGSSPVKGKKDAPIVLVKFSDIQCPFCNRFYPPVAEVLKAYPDKVRFMVKNYPLPFHPKARPAAKLALAANEQGKYFEMFELLLQNAANIDEGKVKEYAKTLGLNYNKLMEDLKNKDAQWEKQIEEDMALAEKSDVRGTPTFFLNGKKTNARDLNTFKAEIDKILAQKK